MGQQWPAAWLGALSAAVPAWDILKEVSIILITSTIVWPQVKQQGGGTQPCHSTENWIKDLLSMAWSSWSTKESEMQYLDAISKMTE